MHASIGSIRPLSAILLAVAATAIIAMTLAVSFDIAEDFWRFTRSLEQWEVDELFIAASAAAVVGLAIAMWQVVSLSQEIAKLRLVNSDAGQKQSEFSNGFENIVRCTFCSKFQLGEGEWLSDSDYVATRCDATVIGGVCPSCRES